MPVKIYNEQTTDPVLDPANGKRYGFCNIQTRNLSVAANRKKRSGLVPEYYVYRLFYCVFFYMGVKIEIGNLLAGNFTKTPRSKLPLITVRCGGYNSHSH